MTNLPSVAVVILNWNGIAYLKQFLPSVCASTYPNLEIIDETDNGIKAISIAQEKNPDVIIMDIGLLGLDGIESTKRIKKINPQINIQLVIHLSLS
jgi:DNA-binding NarL/FixJ family response regulator